MSYDFTIENTVREEPGFPGGSVGKESACNAGVAGAEGSTPGSGRSPGAQHGNPLQYSCLENPTDRGAYSPWGRKESDTTDVTPHTHAPQQNEPLRLKSLLLWKIACSKGLSCLTVTHTVFSSFLGC